MSLHVPVEMEKCRIREGRLASTKAAGANGAFLVRCPGRGVLSTVISDGEGWEHVSVSTPNRCPVWEEMEWVKHQFWGDDDTVMQLHVPVDDHINHHPFCLHLWRPVEGELPRPPGWLVGPVTKIAKGGGSNCHEHHTD